MSDNKHFIVLFTDKKSEKIRLVQTEENISVGKLQKLLEKKFPDLKIKLVDPIHHKDFHAMALFLPIEEMPLKKESIENAEMLDIGPVSV